MNTCTDVYAENTGMHGITCPYIYTKGTCVHVVTPIDKSKVNKFIHGRTDAYDECGSYDPVWDKGTDVVGKVRKEISYADALHQGS